VRKLLAKSWRTLHEHGLVTDERQTRLQGAGGLSHDQPIDQRDLRMDGSARIGIQTCCRSGNHSARAANRNVAQSCR
jgi:hypothetical protein